MLYLTRDLLIANHAFYSESEITYQMNVRFWHKADVQTSLQPQYSLPFIRYIDISLTEATKDSNHECNITSAHTSSCKLLGLQ